MTIASVFVVRFFQHGKGFVIAAVFILLLAINLAFFIVVKSVQNQMKRDKAAENHLRAIMTPDESVDIFVMMPRNESVNRMPEPRNYCYDIVFQEINSVYND